MSQLLIKPWLAACCCMVVFMIFWGGLTRLTDAGLSIVEWKPVSGIVPPLNNAEWQDEFSKYQQSVEYKQKNINMTLFDWCFANFFVLLRNSSSYGARLSRTHSRRRK